MGIDIDGGMIVGANREQVENIIYNEEHDGFLVDGEYVDDFYDWIDYHKMECYSIFFDAEPSFQVIGFTVKDVDPLSLKFDDWVSDVKHKAQQFQALTDVKAELIGMQNVW